MVKQVGELDRRITLKNPTISTDAFGEAVRTYSTLSDVWAKVEYLTSDEKEENERLTNITKMKFTIRYRSDVDAKTKIEWHSDTYEVDGILPEGREKFLVLIARKRE